MEGNFREYYINDLRTTTCSGVLGHRTDVPISPFGSIDLSGDGTGDWPLDLPFDSADCSAGFVAGSFGLGGFGELKGFVGLFVFFGGGVVPESLKNLDWSESCSTEGKLLWARLLRCSPAGELQHIMDARLLGELVCRFHLQGHHNSSWAIGLRRSRRT